MKIPADIDRELTRCRRPIPAGRYRFTRTICLEPNFAVDAEIEYAIVEDGLCVESVEAIAIRVRERAEGPEVRTEVADLPWLQAAAQGELLESHIDQLQRLAAAHYAHYASQQ